MSPSYVAKLTVRGEVAECDDLEVMRLAPRIHATDSAPPVGVS